MPFGFEVREHEKKQDQKQVTGYKKRYVDVMLLNSKEGDIVPHIVFYDETHKYEVDKILDVRKAASLKAGGSGIRYTVMICGKQTHLFLDDFEHRWFVEEKVY